MVAGGVSSMEGITGTPQQGTDPRPQCTRRHRWNPLLFLDQRRLTHERADRQKYERGRRGLNSVDEELQGLWGVLWVGEGELKALRLIAFHGYRELLGAKFPVPRFECIRPRRQPFDGEGPVSTGDREERVR